MSPQTKSSGPVEGSQPGFGQGEGARARSASPKHPAVLIRKLPRNTTPEVLNSMLLFAQDLIAVDFVDSADARFSTAVARFQTEQGARETRAMLHGKQNSTRDANMIVELLPFAQPEPPSRRRVTLEQGALGADLQSLAASGPWSTRFNDAFQPLDRVSPGSKPGLSSSDSAKQDAGPHQGYFPHQAVGSGLGVQSNRGKSVIGQDVDDETGKLLDDPVAFMRNDLQAMSIGGLAQGRRSTLPHIPTSRFGQMTVSTSGMASPPPSGVVSPRMGPLQSPAAYSPPNMASMGPNASYQFGGQQFARQNLPPINPSDQNPPCNTLYVGNLPMDASEDELKALFCKQRGYKRLCLRTKSNGPMCFVEFEDIQCASKALTECYGMPLHNSTKGGIRLSFSKNPLGVRNGQPGSMSSASPMSPHGSMSSLGGMAPFSSVNGPPPGLNPPPGLVSHPTNGNVAAGMASPGSAGLPHGFGAAVLMSPIGTSAVASYRSPTTAIGQGWNWPAHETRTDLPASMMGR